MKIAELKEILMHLPSSLDESNLIVTDESFTIGFVAPKKSVEQPLQKETVPFPFKTETDPEIPYISIGGSVAGLPGMEVEAISIPESFLNMQGKLTNKITLPEIKEYMDLYRQKKSISNCLQTNFNRKLYSVAGKLTDSIIKEFLKANKLI